MFRLCRLISVPSRVPSRVVRHFGLELSSLPCIQNPVNERTSASGSGHVAAPPGYFSHDHALRYGDPRADCDSALLAQYYSVFKNWHRIRVALPPVWSCDWRCWDEGPYFDYLEQELDGLYGVSTLVEPMAFLAGQCDPTFLFFTGGEYYLYEMGTLTRFREHFTSHEDFLRRFESYVDSGVLVPTLRDQ
ncbi:hypothetical protein C8J57DRAFT_1532193 [Mycena rebaudengoi]|nr:hypothetical protein C8J57DRAFT_1532193 [Mycena rebaudengoi]